MLQRHYMKPFQIISVGKPIGIEARDRIAYKAIRPGTILGKSSRQTRLRGVSTAGSTQRSGLAVWLALKARDPVFVNGDNFTIENCGS